MIKSALACALAVVAVAGTASVAGAAAPRPKNLIQNSGAEAGPGSVGTETNTPPAWTVVTGTTFSALIYGDTATDGPTPTDPGPANRGANLFYGGYGDAVAAATQSPTIPSSLRSSIDAGTATFTLQGYLGGWESQGDNAMLSVVWRNVHGRSLGSATIGPVTPADRGDVTELLLRHTSGTVPARTRSALVTLTLTRTDGMFNDGYADNLALRITP